MSIAPTYTVLPRVTICLWILVEQDTSIITGTISYSKCFVIVAETIDLHTLVSTS